MFYVFKIKRFIGALFIVIGIVFVYNAIFKNQSDIEVFSLEHEPSYTIVVDAGHGYPDGRSNFQKWCCRGFN